MLKLKTILSDSTGYSAAIVISSFTIWALYDLWHVDLRYPIIPLVRDAVAGQALLFKGMIDNPWYVDNKWLGAPFSMNLRDFPGLDYFVLPETKLITFFTKNHNLVRNIVALTSFPLITVTSLYAMRRLGIRYSIALMASLLYAFSSYHHMRLGVHLVLAIACFAVPLATLLMLEVFESRSFLIADANGGSKLLWLNSRHTWGALSACVVIGVTGMVYYPFFTCFLLVTVGLAATIHGRSLLPLLRSLCLTAVVGLSVLLILTPTIVQNWIHGHTGVINRPPADAELYGLKIVQLVIPGAGHRYELLNQLSEYYNTRAPLVTENQSSYLGIVGVAGFAFLLCAGLAGNRVSARIRALSIATYAALLLATIGGFSSIISFTFSSTIRSYNRISVYIGYFALLAVALGIEKAATRWGTTWFGRAILYASMAALTWFGVRDQYFGDNKYAEFKQQYKVFDAFIARIERSLPSNSSIYQFPYYAFNDITDYRLFHPYIHSKKLHWSYGSSAGRRGDLWHSRVAAMPTERALEALVLAGFSGAYVARDEYKDHGAAVEAALQLYLGSPSIVGPSNDAAFYSFSTFASRFTSKLSTGEFNQRRTQLLDRPYLSWGHGFYGPNIHGGLVNAWGKKRNVFLIENPASHPVTVLFSATVRVANPPATVHLSGSDFDVYLQVVATGYHFTRHLAVEPGPNHFKLETNSERATSGINVFDHDPRVGIEDASIEVVTRP
jgi:phosphoglycerol transferase